MRKARKNEWNALNGALMPSADLADGLIESAHTAPVIVPIDPHALIALRHRLLTSSPYIVV